MSKPPNQDEIADLLEEIADLLDVQDANVFRVRSYRQGARTIRESDADIAGMAEREDRDALMALPNIGVGLANVIIEYVTTGRSSLRDELRGQTAPGALFAQIPGIGEELAARIADELQINSLEELEQAAYDGRLEQVEGFGERRLKMVRTSLAGILGGAAQRRQREPGESAAEPSIALLLEIDAEYRRRAAEGDLPTIAPKRFNPEGEKWLPILNTTREGWKFTALFSNTARAHELDKTRDWVVIYFEPAEGGPEGQRTVVTQQGGALDGRRVVRGRERDTRAHYDEQS
jgi:putative hydrolase